MAIYHSNESRPSFPIPKKRFRNHLLQRCRCRRPEILSSAPCETGSSEAPYHPGMGPVGPEAANRFHRRTWPRFAEILSGTAGRAISATGFSNKKPGQVAGRPRLAARGAPRSLIGFAIALKLPESQLYFALVDAAAPITSGTPPHRVQPQPLTRDGAEVSAIA